MGNKTNSNPYRIQAEMPAEAPDDWSARLARLQERKAQRKGAAPASWSGSAGCTAVPGASGPGARQALASIVESCTTRVLSDDEALRITVECKETRAAWSESGPTVSITWQLPTALEDSGMSSESRDHFGLLRTAHAQCIGWLYAVTKQEAYLAGREVMRDQLQALHCLLALRVIDVSVIGFCGCRRQLSDSAPSLQRFVRQLEVWEDGAPPATLVDHAKDCLRSLGWRGEL